MRGALEWGPHAPSKSKTDQACEPAEARRAFHSVERAARGKAARAEVPRSSHADWEPSPRRPSPVELLEEQAQTRVPELVPIRYGRMLVSPFTFYRGAAYLMASDLAGRRGRGCTCSSAATRTCRTSARFAAPDRRLVFGVNDFDETLPGPFEWDVKRLVASFAVAGRDRGFDGKQRAVVNVAVGRGLSRGDARVRRDAEARPLVLAHRRRASSSRRSSRWATREAAQAGGAEPRQGAGEGQPARRSTS